MCYNGRVACERRALAVRSHAPEKTNLLTPTPKERLTAHPAVVLLLFVPVLLLSQLGRSLLTTAVLSLFPSPVTSATYLTISLFATLVTVASVLLYCLLAERRSLLSLGFTKRDAGREYALGILGGLVLFGLPILLCIATGTLDLTITRPAPTLLPLLLCLAGFLIQGASEELLCRSYLMVSLSRGLPLWACAVINALLFSLLHLGNPGVTIIALANIFLFGIFASLLTLRRGSVWMVCAIHSMWNFSQGNLFGIPVSGLAGLPSPLTAQVAEGGWQTLVNGGAFGLEGGLAVTVVLAVACSVVMMMPTKQSEVVR